MAENTDDGGAAIEQTENELYDKFSKMKVVDLKKFLKIRGVQGYKYAKKDLIALAVRASCLQVDTIEEKDDTVDVMKARLEFPDGKKKVALPYVSSITTWTEDLKEMPVLEMPHVIAYLISKCDWTSNNVQKCRESRGYQLAEQGHIHGVKLHVLSDFDSFKLLYLKALCTRQTSQGEAPYQVWGIVTAEGVIHTGGCECTADDGKCKHVIALWFAMVAFHERRRDRGAEVSTDQTCKWDKPRQESRPLPVKEIDFRLKTVKARPVEPTPERYNPCQAAMSSMDTASIVDAVFELAKATGGVFAHILDPDPVNTQVPLGPPSMMDMARDYKQTSRNMTLMQYINMRVSPDSCDLVERLTKNQDTSPTSEWSRQRHGRITASNAKNAASFTGNNIENYITDKIFQRKLFSSKATLHGQKYEPIARETYFDQYKVKHKGARIRSSGFTIDKANPHLGASPDGIIECKCCGIGLVEIKCPYTHRDKSPYELGDPKLKYHVTKNHAGTVHLKTSSSWYVQVQMQLAVSGRDWCDFVLYTNKYPYMSVERIYFNIGLWQDLVQKLNGFFDKFVEPCLLDM